jgi:hypothetical protein
MTEVERLLNPSKLPSGPAMQAATSTFSRLGAAIAVATAAHREVARAAAYWLDDGGAAATNPVLAARKPSS